MCPKIGQCLLLNYLGLHQMCGSYASCKVVQINAVVAAPFLPHFFWTKNQPANIFTPSFSFIKCHIKFKILNDHF